MQYIISLLVFCSCIFSCKPKEKIVSYYINNMIKKLNVAKKNIQTTNIIKNKDSTIFLINEQYQVYLHKKSIPFTGSALYQFTIKDTLLFLNKKMPLICLLDNFKKNNINLNDTTNLLFIHIGLQQIHIKAKKYLLVTLVTAHSSNNYPILNSLILIAIDDKINEVLFYFILPTFHDSFLSKDLDYSINDFDNNEKLNFISFEPYKSLKNIQFWEVDEDKIILLKEPYITLKKREYNFNPYIIDEKQSNFQLLDNKTPKK